MHLTLTCHRVTASAKARTITGVATRYGQRADASTGPVIFEAGSLDMAEDLSRVKLLIDHDQRQPVGYATSRQDSAEDLVMTFHVPASEAGDLALAQAANGLRDGLSVGAWADEVTYDEDGTARVQHAVVREVSLCALPAFDAARVSDVATTTGRNTMPCATCGTIHPHGATCVAASPAPSSYPTAPPAGKAPEPATPPAGSAAGAADAPPVPPAAPTAPGKVAASQAAAPVTPPGGGGRRVTLAQAAQLVGGLVAAGGSGAQVQAALNDITPASLPGAATMEDPWLRDTYLGELWTAAKTARPFFDLFGPTRPITGMKVYGWRWKTRPTVADYAGNKTPVPSSQAGIEAESAVERIAGGWDVDRIYVDLGDPALIEALWAAALEDYLAKSEAKLVAKVKAAAATVAPAASLPAALVQLGSTASGLGARISGVAIAGDLWGDFANLTKDQVPWWLGSGDNISIGTTEGTVGGTRFWVDTTLASGEYLAADSRAVTPYEKNPPVRVNAVDLPKGGIDLGLFGYVGAIVNDARAVLHGTVA